MNTNTFNWKQYLLNYPDLAKSGITNQNSALIHWNRYGKNEFRTDKPLKKDVSMSNKKLLEIQSKIKLVHGDFNMEIPEMLMSIKFLNGNEKVLELGSNVGRNTFIIASILNNNGNNNLVTLECNPAIYNQLIINKQNNKFNFYAENCALSSKYVFSKGWDTLTKDTPEVPSGYISVKTITYSNLLMKYKINFDTLVLDCEGSFYYILLDFPDILDNIKLIITENDYLNIEHLNYVTGILLNKGFKNVYRQPLLVENPMFTKISKDRFFEVWKLIN